MAISATLREAAKELLDAYNRGVTIFEDFTFRGCSPNVKMWNDAIADGWYDRGGKAMGYRAFFQRIIDENTPPPSTPTPAPTTNRPPSAPAPSSATNTAPKNLQYTVVTNGPLGLEQPKTLAPVPVLHAFERVPTPLVEGQYELLSPISSFLFGEGNTGIRVEEVDHGEAEARTDDQPNPLKDGMRQGREFYNGRTLTFTINIKVPRRAEWKALDLADEMAAAWSGDDIREIAEGYYILRNRRGGRTRRVIGRPRKFKAKSQLSTTGWIPVTCTFDTITHHYYGDDINSVTALMPTDKQSRGRVTWPLRWPLRFEDPTESAMSIARVRGPRPAWPVVKISAPQGIINPTLKFDGLGEIPIRATLPKGMDIILDTRPWVESVVRSDGANMMGAVINCPPLHRLKMPRGNWGVSLAGIDPSRTAYAEVQWAETYANF